MGKKIATSENIARLFSNCKKFFTNVVNDESIIGKWWFKNGLKVPFGEVIDTGRNKTMNQILATKADDNNVMHKDGEEFVEGQKTFVDGLKASFDDIQRTGEGGSLQAALDAKADDSAAVHKTGNETIDGTKFFKKALFIEAEENNEEAFSIHSHFDDNERNVVEISGSNDVVILRGLNTEPENDSDAANKKYVDDQIGTGAVQGRQVVGTQATDTFPYVEYVEQSLTDSQKAQARANIGADYDSKIGELSDLETTDKSSIVNAINEAKSSGVSVVDNLESDSSTSALAAKQGKVLKGLVNGKYAKPSNGIPKADLSSAVQTSLDKAEDIDNFRVETNEEGWFLADKNLNVAIKYTNEGLDFAKLSTHAKTLLDTESSDISEAEHTAYYGGNALPKIRQYNKIGASRLMGNVTCQGCAIFGKYLFQFKNYHAEMRIYDLDSKSLVQTITMESNTKDHCNTVCFSGTYYDESDSFPLLYTSGSPTGSYNHIQVWRIIVESSVFSITKIQEITLPTGTESNDWMWGQAYIDIDYNAMWYSNNDNVNGVRTGAVFKRFDIPSVFDDSGDVIPEVTLTDTDIKDTFHTMGLGNQQGGVVYNGVLYLADGVPSNGTGCLLFVIDLLGKGIINRIDLTKIGITAEPEGAGVYNGHLYITTNGSGIYKIYF